jgi:hypothetical protein
MAYADGELTLEESAALEARLRQDAGLRERLEPFAETRRQLASVFEPTLQEPIPDRLLAAIARAPVGRRVPPTTSFFDRVRSIVSASTESLFPNGFTPAMAASMAALVAVGAAGGWLGGRATAPTDLVAVAGSGLVASGTLADALERKLSGTATKSEVTGAVVTPVLSFPTTKSGMCREYRIAAETGPEFAGLACRTTDGVWRVALHIETPKQPPAAEGYQTAAGASVLTIDALVDTMISGPALGRDDEAALLKNGWRTAP